MNRNLALAAAALATLACSPDFDPASKIEKLRVVGIRADPPEIEPVSASTVAPDRAALTSLVLRPEDFDPAAARTTTVVHVACVPTPGDPTPSPCVMLETLRDPTVAIASAAQAYCAGGGGGDPPSIGFAGVEVCRAATCVPAVVGGTPLPPQVAVPAAFAFPAAGPERILGVQAVVLAFALDATPDELVAGAGTTCPMGDIAARFSELWPAREHVLATKRVVIRGPDMPPAEEPNRNPVIDGIRAGEANLIDPLLTTTLAGGTIPLRPILPASPDFQPYAKRDAAGLVIESTVEEWVYSWFSTAGEIDELHTHGSDPDDWTVSGASAVVAVVVRDLRGGTHWGVRRVVVAP